ncbi:hypothetical protein [Novosphingobium sp. 9U]|uniref:hypothetical protein n=1 Tax=Novosphingobium sp. 9U TaxID=2653158 RepID=UPI0012F1FE7A|nr:hypothetical protein [Novosphingobium sp. 9U]VWX50197.1 exported hypothetical protein [Novosphingobium sp. 9U]
MTFRTLPAYLAATAIGLAGSLLPFTTQAQDAPDADPKQVQFTAEPYVWAPTVDGTVSLGVLSLPIHVRPQDLASGLRLGAMGRAALSKGRATLAIEGIGVDFKRDRFVPLLGQDVKVRVLALEMTGGYRFDLGRSVAVTPLLGLRYNSINARFGTAPAVLRAKGDWAEPAAGLLVAARPARRLELQGKLLAGRRDSQRHSLDLRGEVAYALHPRTQVFASYRYLKQNYASASAEGLAIDLGGDGPLAGLRHRF